MKSRSAASSLEPELLSDFQFSSYRSLWALAFGLLVAVLLFMGGLGPMTLAWQTEEYSHAYLIPLISLFLFIQRFPQLSGQTPHARTNALGFVVAGVLLLVLGELSSLATLIQYGFIVCAAGVLVSVMGTNGLRGAWMALAYLIFMIPLPTLLQNNLSHDLQLISSAIGVAIVRLFSISVYLEGNVIDLGSMKLQVVDACSGLRYLFPLMSFGFLIAALYRAPAWQRLLIFFSTIPITILMNSLRIGLVGITVEYFGIAAAEGFLHYFEGWFIFIMCIALLVLLIQSLRWLTRQEGSLIDQLHVQLPDSRDLRVQGTQIGQVGKSYWICMGFMLVLLPLVQIYGMRHDTFPQRQSFSAMPLVHAGWLGREGTLEQDILDNLKLTDYFYADFVRDAHSLPVNFYMAYYNSQKKGAGIHSPKSCIPGGGWEIKQFDKHQISAVPLSSATGDFIVNRAIIQKSEVRSVVYYWFQQRGRIVHDEYLNRWYIFADSVTHNRSDGALVRVSVPWPAEKELAEIDEHAREFIADFYPMLSQYLPD